MGHKVTFNSTTKIIQVHIAPVDGIVDIDVKIDIYSDGKEDWKSDATLNKFLFPVTAVGGDPLPGSKALGSTFFLEYGWVIRPYESNHTMQVNGNLYSRDDDSPFIPTVGNFNVFTVQSVSSLVDSTVQQLAEIEHSVFNDGVTIDIAKGYSGTAYPVGTNGRPSNNILDAHTIAEERGFIKFFIRGILTLDSGDFSDGHIFKGESPMTTQIIITDPANLTNCEFLDSHITGVIDPNTVIRSCIVGAVTSYNGYIWESAITGPIILDSVDAGETHIINSWSNDILDTPPVIDMNGAGTSLAVRRYAGSFIIDNKTGPEKISIDMDSGRVIINPTVTAGEIIVRGIGRLVNNSTGTTIVTEELVNGIEISNIKNMIELTRAHHAVTGDVYYWDPHNGDDSNEGDAVTRAVKTFAQAHNLAKDNNHDLIICIAGNTAGRTITTENILITKNYLMVRGPGRDFEINSADDSLDAIDIQSNGVEISSMRVTANTTNTQWIVHSVGSFTLLKDLYITNGNNAIHFEDDDFGVMDNLKIHHNVGIGIKISGSAEHVNIVDSHIGTNGGDGILLDTLSGHEVNINGDTVIHRNSGYGINITTNTHGVIISDDVLIFNNTLGDINDLGIDTYDARDNNNINLATEVWEYVPSSVVADSFGDSVNQIEVTVGNMVDVINNLIKYQRNKSVIDPVNHTLTIYEDDGTTPLTVFNLQDEAGIASILNIFRRIPIPTGSP